MPGPDFAVKRFRLSNVGVETARNPKDSASWTNRDSTKRRFAMSSGPQSLVPRGRSNIGDAPRRERAAINVSGGDARVAMDPVSSPLPSYSYLTITRAHLPPGEFLVPELAPTSWEAPPAKCSRWVETCLDSISMDEEGPFFDDFRVGLQFSGKVGRTITETDNVWFTLLTGNSNQIHFNEDYTRRNFAGEPFNGRRVVNGFLTMAIAAGILVDVTSQNGFQVGIEGVRFTRPVFHGDTLYADAKVLEARESRSRPGFGLVRIHTRGLNERGDPVVEFDRVFMVRKRGVAWRDARPE